MNFPPVLALASISPRRRHLLDMLGEPFTVEPSGVDESLLRAPTPAEFARLAARAKCLDVAARLADNTVVIGADTVVHFDDTFLGKPADPDEATEMLRALSGRTHWVTTGVAVRRPGDALRVESETSGVRFRPLSDEEIAAYVATGESLDKAGAYAVQGLGGKFIERVDGDLQNVIGLPLRLLIEMLADDFPHLTMPPEIVLREFCEQPTI